MLTNEFYNEISNMNLSSDDLISLICDYFDSNVLTDLMEFVKSEYQ